MKAVMLEEYGPPEVLRLKEIEKPVPKENEVLIKVFATSVGYGDLLARNFRIVTPRKFNMPFLFWFMAKIFFGFKKPRISILGSEFSGEVDSVGKNVNGFNKGDQVFGYLGQNMGAYAEYICMAEKGCITIKPANMTYEEAAVIPMGAIMALNLLKKANIIKGQKVLINGASGGIGSAAVQIAKYFGAEVTGICSAPRLDYIKSLGADKMIDYTKEDFTQNGEIYDLIFDVLGRVSFSQCKKSLSQYGRLQYASFKFKQLMQMLGTSMSNKKVVCAIAPGSKEDLIQVKELIEAGKIKSIIDRSFPLEQASDAHRYAEEGKRKGSIVVRIIK